MTEIAKNTRQVTTIIKSWKKEGFSIGFVPTMGYLHEGHQSLIARSAEENDKTVVSIFVNPMQFAPREDLASYPRDFEHDRAICEKMGVDLIFHPEPSEMYGEGFVTFVDMSGLPEELCGLSRPHHFRGVCTIVAKLFNIVRPDRAYFGRKDAQQLAVVTRMAKDLNMGVEVIGCPIIRENDGLAKSSRNTYLNPAEREAARCLFEAVTLGQTLVSGGEKNASAVLAVMKEHIAKEKLAKIDYIKMVDASTMKPVEKIEKTTQAVLCAVAVFFGKTRLIDNFICEPPSP